MNPVFAVDLMNHPEGEKESKSAIFRKPYFWICLGLGALLDLMGATFLGNLIIFFMLMVLLNRYVLDGAIHGFQHRVLPWIMGHYESLLRWALKGWRPVHLLLGTFALLIISFMVFSASIKSGRVGVVFFPKADPNQIYVYLKLPVGTNVEFTDSVTRVLESRVVKVLDMEKGKTNPLVESVISNVAIGASDPTAGDRSTRSELGRVQVSFVEFEKRDGVSTKPYLDKIRAAMKGVPGAEISVDQEGGGPPTDPPINIEIASEEFDALIKTASHLKNYLDSAQIAGVEELKMDIDLNNPEITISVDRERALVEGVSSGQIGQEIRTALFGREVSKVKEGKDEYKIQLRNNELQRKSLTDLLNMRVSFRDMGSGGAIKHIPISALVKVEPTATLGSVKRKNQKRLITLRSNVLESQGYNATGVNAEIAKYIANFKKKDEGVTIKQTGEGEQQAETGAFLGKALVIALMLILFVLVVQFNSVSKSVIILTEIIFSVIGVLLGFAITGMEVSVLMTGLGIVGLAGIVVKNGILVIEFTDELRGRGIKTREAVIQAGKTRIIPVLLTAVAAILAFIPIAVGFNINFVTLFSELNPHIFFGGDNVAFWKPLSWTIIFGLAFAFFMTLFMVPGMYLIAERLKRPMRRMFGGKWISFLGIPPMIFLFMPLMIVAMIGQRINVYSRRKKLMATNQKVNEAFIGSWF
jgi:multidrug efflux pump subunit AcrB